MPASLVSCTRHLTSLGLQTGDPQQARPISGWCAQFGASGMLSMCGACRGAIRYRPNLPPLPQPRPPPLTPAKAQPLLAAPGPAPRPQAPPGGRWLDRDTNGCLNLQRIGESMQRPLEMCSWKDLEALAPVGKEYQQGYKRVNDRLPKVRQRLHRAAEYRRGIDGRARNNAQALVITQAVSLKKAVSC
ncbi:hypothetical protein QJQ45_001739 [Haematococcus lacustris]|nr:hypothetical protein QJQ45_001739 [Haematococcus lacustris]